MRLLQLGVVALLLPIVGALSTGATAGECQKVAAAGDGLTTSIATLMSTAGLKNIIEGKGMKGQGAVKTACTSGTFLVECRSQQTACK